MPLVASWVPLNVPRPGWAVVSLNYDPTVHNWSTQPLSKISANFVFFLAQTIFSSEEKGKTNKMDIFIIEGPAVRTFKFQTNFFDIFIWFNKLFSMKFINIVRTL